MKMLGQILSISRKYKVRLITGCIIIALFMVAIFFLLSVFERTGEGTLPLPVLAYMFM